MKLNKLSLLILFIFIASALQAQVTVGMSEAPASGALLQLKTLADNVSSGGANASKGLGLPRMVLTKQFDLTDVLPTVSANDREDHAGLVVYQLGYQNNEDGIFCPGVYVWNGAQWNPLFDLNKYDKTRFDPVTETLYDSEGNDYRTADFGDAGRWMTQNLRSRMVGICGTVDLSNADVNAEWAEPRFFYPEGLSGGGNGKPTSNWTPQWGYLYNWAAATNKKGGSTGKLLFGAEEDSGNTNPDVTQQIQGICPKGWHLPSDKEWNDLKEAIGLNPQLYTQTISNISDWDDTWRTHEGSRGNNLGTYMKAKNSILANIPSNGDSRPYDVSAKRGFDALLVGNAERGNFNLFGKYAFFWSSSADDTSKGSANPGAWMHQVEANPSYPGSQGMVTRVRSERYYLYSVRCKQDGTGKTKE